MLDMKHIIVANMNVPLLNLL